MITKTSTTLTNLKNLFIEIFLDKTSKVSNVADGSVVNATAYGVAKIAQKAMKDVAIVEAQIFPESATGDYLDRAAALYGVSPRKGALGSSTYVRVYALPGTIYTKENYFVNKNGIRFSVDEDLIVGESGYGYVKVRSVNAGYAMNVAPNSITNVSPQPEGHIECTNEYYAIGGRDSEDDETFRIRITNNLNTLSKGTLEYWTQIFQNIDDRVLKVMSSGLDEEGKYTIYIVSQNGIHFTDDELKEMLEKAQSYFPIQELNIEGDVVGIALKNIDWFYVGSDRGLDFRVHLDPDYDVATVRKNIQVALTKSLDFRFWKVGDKVEWDNLLSVVKNAEGVKYVPDEYFFPYYDQSVPANQLPRIRGFVMRDETGNILYDSDSNLSPLFYPADSEDKFKGLTDAALNVYQTVYFTVKDEQSNPIENARITVGNNAVLTDENGNATLSLENGAYNYLVTKDFYENYNGAFVVLNSSVSVTVTLIYVPWDVTFEVYDEQSKPIVGAEITINGKIITTSFNGRASIKLKNGDYPYTITKLGYKTLQGDEYKVTVNNSDTTVRNNMELAPWTTSIFVNDEVSGDPIVSAIVHINDQDYLTNESGQVIVELINGTYPFTISKRGYEMFSSNLIVNNRHQAVTYELTPIAYNVTVNCINEKTRLPIQGVAFTVLNTDIAGVTDVYGQFRFKAISDRYNYIATKQEYESVEGEFNVNFEDLNFTVEMTERHFDTTIKVIDQDEDPVVGALVSINEEQQTTDNKGEAHFSLQNGSYKYDVTKLGFDPVSGTIEVYNEDKTFVVNTVGKLFNIIFIVQNESGALLEGATLTIDGEEYVTDSKGQISLHLKNGNYPYTIRLNEYDDYSGELVVVNEDKTETVRMQEKEYSVVFTVKEKDSLIALENASITIDGIEDPIITNSGGIATTNLKSGRYNYTATLEKYITQTGSFSVDRQDVQISIEMEKAEIDVTLRFKGDFEGEVLEIPTETQKYKTVHLTVSDIVTREVLFDDDITRGEVLLKLFSNKEYSVNLEENNKNEALFPVDINSEDGFLMLQRSYPDFMPVRTTFTTGRESETREFTVKSIQVTDVDVILSGFEGSDDPTIQFKVQDNVAGYVEWQKDPSDPNRVTGVNITWDNISNPEGGSVTKTNFEKIAEEGPQIPTENGVYIQDIDGNFWTSKEWNQDNSRANGVAVVDSRHPEGGFVIAKEHNIDDNYQIAPGNPTSSVYYTRPFLELPEEVLYPSLTYKNTGSFSLTKGSHNFSSNADGYSPSLTTKMTTGKYLGATDKTDWFESSLLSKEHTWSGTPIEEQIPTGLDYRVEFSDVEGYYTPETQSFIAEDGNTREIEGLYRRIIPSATIIFNKTISDPSNITGDINQKAIAEIVKRHRRCLCKKTAEGEVAICYLDDNNSNLYHDGTSAKLDGTEGDVMVVRPEFWYKWASVDSNKFSETLSVEEIVDGIHVEMSLIGAYKAYQTGSKLYSRSGVSPTVNTSWTSFDSYAKARGKGYSMIDLEQHNMIALILYAKYGNRNLQAVLGAGRANYFPMTNTGTTNNLGNQDTVQNDSDGYVNGLGLEGVFGGIYEMVGGVKINNRVWTITNPDGTQRTVNAGTSDGWITHIKGEESEIFDVIPTQTGGRDTTYYSDYYWQTSSSDDRVLYRSHDSWNTSGGVSCTYASYSPSHTDAHIGSRLAFRGKIRVIESVSEFKALPVL